MNQQQEDELRLRLRKLAESSPQSADGGAERRLLEAFRARRSLRPAQHKAAKYFAAIAASMLVGAALYLFSHAAPSRVPVRQAPAAESMDGAAAGFVALPYAQSGVPLEQAVVVRVNIPSARARSFGVPFNPGRRENVNA